MMVTAVLMTTHPKTCSLERNVCSSEKYPAGMQQCWSLPDRCRQIVLALFVLLAGCLLSRPILADKQPIDSSVYASWPSLGSERGVSTDGRYLFYSIQNRPVGGHTLVLQATNAGWTVEIGGATDASFSADSKQAIFLTSDHFLGVSTLGTDSLRYVPAVESFKVSQGPRGSWLAYMTNGAVSELVLSDLVHGTQQRFDSVLSYQFTDDGRALLLQTQSSSASAKDEEGTSQAMMWVDLSSLAAITFWRGGQVSDITIESGGRRLAFVANELKEGGQERKSIWHYKALSRRAQLIISDRDVRGDDNLRIDGISGFSKDHRHLHISLRGTDALSAAPNSGAAAVDVWGYRDAKLQSQQLADMERLGDASRQTTQEAVVTIEDGRVTRLDKALRGTPNSSFPAHSAELMLEEVDSFAQVGNPRSAIRSTYLVSTEDGQRLQLPIPETALGAVLAPNARYVLYYDQEKKAFFSYEVASGALRNLTNGVSTTWPAVDADMALLGARSAPRGIAGWLRGGNSVLLYDRFDIWQVDLASRSSPICLTNKYGAGHGIVLALASDYANRVFDNDAQPLLLALDALTKDNGFFRMAIGRRRDPIELTMGPYFYEIQEGGPNFGGELPLRARDAEVYVVQRMSATDAPNLFSTTDWKTFTPLSDVHPERAYNWMTSELVTWEMTGGESSQGILFKPENFNPSKRYPVIFYYYQKLSDGLNAYVRPEPSYGKLNVAWYVSNGYLVFEPDVRVTAAGELTASAVNVVESAVATLAKRPYVDAKKIGLQGFSFGADETNLIVTHSKLFAAAVSASGIGDFVSGYGSLAGDGTVLQQLFEGGTGQMRMGASLWERPDFYIKNSAILDADKVTTPLLMMQTKKDGVSPFANAVEFFTGLRRLGKKVWMLQYDDGDHGVSGKSADDFTIRMAQFFDHYLKGAPPPKWMTEGVPARLKGIETGLELDTSGREP